MSRSSIRIAHIAGIPVKVHWTFGFLILFVLYFAYSNSLSYGDTFWFFSYVLILFVFVIMHEFGHALAARRYGVVTKDVIISPIGGVARLESIPKNPKHELVIALAGPAVNLGLAVFFGTIQVLSFDNLFPIGERINLVAAPQDYISYLLLINVALIAFNLIPAFPMDGGRVLRSLLTLYLDNRLKATKIASIIGQIFAVGFLLAGYLSDQNFMLVFIGIFVFIMARNEYRQIAIEHHMSNTKIGDVVTKGFDKIKLLDRMQGVFDKGLNRSYLVFDENDKLCGALPDLFIKDARERNDGDSTASKYLSQSFGLVSKTMTLNTVFHAMNNYGWSIVAVVDDENKIIGVTDRNDLGRVIKGIR